MNVFIYCNLTIICFIVKVTINRTIASSLEVSVIAQWIRHSHVVREVAISPLAGGGKFFGVLEAFLECTCCIYVYKLYIIFIVINIMDVGSIPREVMMFLRYNKCP